MGGKGQLNMYIERDVPEHNAQHPAGVARQRRPRGAGLNVPQPRRVIPGSRGEGAAVRRVGHAVDTVCMAYQSAVEEEAEESTGVVPRALTKLDAKRDAEHEQRDQSPLPAP